MQSEVRNLVLAALFATLTALGAQIRITLFLIPFTLQTVFVLLAGGLLGRLWGGISMLLYLALGLIGLPVFASGAGPGTVFSPAFGYLLGFPVAAYWVGRQLHGTDRNSLSLWRTWLQMLMGLGWVYLFGVIYLWGIKNLYLGEQFPLQEAILLGFLLFLPVAALKGFVSALLLRFLERKIRV